MAHYPSRWLIAPPDNNDDTSQDVVVQWDDAMTNVRRILESWLEVQGKWSHLAPLFGPKGLSAQLMIEAKRFSEVTRQWRSTIDQARDHGKLSEMLRHTDLPVRLGDLSRGLEAVFKGDSLRNRFSVVVTIHYIVHISTLCYRCHGVPG